MLLQNLQAIHHKRVDITVPKVSYQVEVHGIEAVCRESRGVLNHEDYLASRFESLHELLEDVCEEGVPPELCLLYADDLIEFVAHFLH